jgi:hypothetical protein
VKKVRITKAVLLQALREEPLLKARSWVTLLDAEASTYSRKVKEEGVCQVCAVGAVLRAVLDPETSVGTIHSVANQNATGSCGSVHYASLEELFEGARGVLVEDEPWSALSHAFESLWSYYQTDFRIAPEQTRELVRAQLVRFVEEALPEDISLLAPNSVEFTDKVKLLEEVVP